MAQGEPFNRKQEERLHLSHTIPFWQRVQAALWWLLFTVGACVVMAAPVPLGRQVALSVGDVSPADIRSPRRITYESQVLTEQARARAMAAVPDIYSPPEPRIRREQVMRAREILDFMDSVRQDGYAGPEQRIAWINAIPDLGLSQPVVESLLTLNEESWRRVASEVQAVLDRILREEIREDRLQFYQRRVSSLISLDLTDEEAAVTAELVRGLIRPNTFLNVERTQAEREAARSRVPSQTRTLEAGEIIVRAGDIVDEVDVEALEALGLRKLPSSGFKAVQSTLLVLSVTVLLGAYLHRLTPEFWADRRWPPLLAMIALSFLMVARLVIPDGKLLPFLFPMAAMTMLLAALLELRLAILTTIGLTILISYLADGSSELMAYLLAGSMVGALVLGRGERLILFVWAGILIALMNLAVLLAFRLSIGPVDTAGLAQLAIAAVMNGGLSASITLIGFAFLGSAFGITTSLQLMELSRPTHPLLRQLLLKAPGTYHHTILVSNLGERAAEAIGADPLLTRVGAYYHDIGKTLRPYFFVDNQIDGVNPHDRLDPYTSAQIIISHVKDGLDLARKYRLPPRIQDFIPEHHGTTLVSYFYHKAVQQAGEEGAVHEADFRYPGPRPRSKETAIIMLADSCESAVRAAPPSSREEIDQIVGKLINRRLLDGELDESNLTLRDLDRIRQAFVSTLQGIHHPRIQYPDLTRPADKAAEAQAAPPVLQPELADGSGKQPRSPSPTSRDGGPGNGIG